MSHKNHLKTDATRIKGIALAMVLAGMCALPAPVTHAEPDTPAISATVQPLCNTAAFDAAWNLVQIGLGGTLTFKCGTAPVSIKMSDTKTINKQVAIDGGGGFSLDDSGAIQNFGTPPAMATRTRGHLQHRRSELPDWRGVIV